MKQLSRRDLLGQAAGGMAMVSALQTIGPAFSQSKKGNAPRIRESFDFGWKFHRGDTPGAQEPGFHESGWADVNLPHDWSIEGPFSETAPSKGPGAYLPTGIGWYRKTFSVPADYRDRSVLIDFDGVYQLSEVWINGTYLGKRPYGFVPFAYVLTPHLHFGGENVIAVKADNSQQTNCRWYSGSGIYRHTWLVATNRVHVAHWGTFVTYPRVSKSAATVEVRTGVKNEDKAAARCTLTTAIVDHDGKTVATQEATQEVGANGEYEFVDRLIAEQPNLWSNAEPNMYTVHSTLREQDRVLDEYDTPIGIREVAFDADNGFLLNGERVKLNGACVHEEGGSMGAAAPERVWERRLEILRDMGCNAIRTSHNPFAAEFFDLCDRMGFMVMADTFDEWRVPKGQIGPYGYSLYFDEWHERDVRNRLLRDRNHPSIVIWNAGNEIPDQSAPDGAQTLRGLVEQFHREDPTRLVTAACDNIASDPLSHRVRPEFLALLDVVGYNYVDRWRDRAEKYYSIDRHAFPDRRFVGTESVGMGGGRGDYRSLFATSAGTEILGRFARGRDIDVEQLYKFVRVHDYVAGDFMWTGIDYLGEARWPAKSASSGAIDTCGFKKDAFYFYQSQWTAKPMLHVFPHWNWKGKEGEFIPVSCYTNCETVELFLNGKSIGVRGYDFPHEGMEGRYGNYPRRSRVLRTTADLHLSWDVPYAPGTLKAVGTKDGKPVLTVEVATTGDPAAIGLVVDRDKIAADRRDVAHVTVEIRDAQGRAVPTANNEVTFDVRGDGKLIGVDNGNPVSHEDYKAHRRAAYNGLCLAILQSSAKPGSIQVTASAQGLTPASATITTV